MSRPNFAISMHGAHAATDGGDGQVVLGNDHRGSRRG
jgi:hypothetical protein